MTEKETKELWSMSYLSHLVGGLLGVVRASFGDEVADKLRSNAKKYADEQVKNQPSGPCEGFCDGPADHAAGL